MRSANRDSVITARLPRSRYWCGLMPPTPPQPRHSYRQDHQIAGNDAGLAQLAHRIEMTAAEHLVAQGHVCVLHFTLLPAGKAGTHKEFPIKRVRNAVVQLLLTNRRVRREKDDRLLPLLAEPKGARVEFRSEFFNLLNRTNFLAPDSRADSSSFGRITSSFPARQIQFALKLYF